MTLRTKSEAQQWLVWLGAAVAAVTVYVVLVSVYCDTARLDVLDPRQYRFALPLAIAFAVVVWETRWDGMRRGQEEPEVVHVPSEDVGKADVKSPPPKSSFTLNLQPQPPKDPHLGEAEYAEARMIPHQPIPEYGCDDQYLDLLMKSAELGYPRALAKLGDYAMRREWMVEAYYWLWRAKHAGMGNLERVMAQVRSVWANEGFYRESENEYEGFTYEQGEIGYALLCIDARHNADAAKAWLVEYSPDFLRISDLRDSDPRPPH